MFKSIIATMVVFTATAVNANPLDTLLMTIKHTGTVISVDHPTICKDKTLMGQYTYQPKVIDQMTICINNHKGDNAELLDTVRHEAVHIAQSCNNGPLHSLSSLTTGTTKEETTFLKQVYPAFQFHTELEARVIARDYNELQVANLLVEYCLQPVK